MQFIRRDILNDIGLKQWRTLDFWVVVLLFIVAFWLRMYMHYFGQWVYLYVMRAPFVEFAISWHRVSLTYQADLVSLAFEIGMVTAGIGFNFMFWLAMMVVSVIGKKIAGGIPDTASRWMMAYGFGCLLDWVLILAVDLIVADWKGDAFKLYNLYFAAERNGVAGIFLITFINASYTVLVLVAFYNYMLYLHYGGRIADTYSRLSGHAVGTVALGGSAARSSGGVGGGASGGANSSANSGGASGRAADADAGNERQIPMLPAFPHDTEITLHQLRWICAKAERYRGSLGQRRRVAVTTVALTDVTDPDFREDTVHIGIFETAEHGSAAGGGLQYTLRLYRHFIRLHDGALVEAFGGLAGVRNEARLWLNRPGVLEESGSLDDFLAGRLGRTSTLGDSPAVLGLGYSAESEIAPLAPPPGAAAGAAPGEERKLRRPPPLVRGGRIIR
jgi:hypothetical protein